MNATVSILYDVPLLASNDTKYFDVEWPPAPASVKSRRLEESIDNTQIEDESTTSVVAMLKAMQQSQASVQQSLSELQQSQTSMQQSQASMQQALQALKTHQQETLLQTVSSRSVSPAYSYSSYSDSDLI